MTALVLAAAGAAAVSGLAGCDDGGDDIHVGEIASMRAPCQGFADLLCLRMATDGGPVEYFYSPIDGYSFRWGRRSSIQYTSEVVENPVPDGPGRLYSLETIVSEAWDPPGTRYTLSFHGSDAWFTRHGNNLVMLDTEVECAPAMCDQILAGESEAHDITFELTTDPFVPLRAVAYE